VPQHRVVVTGLGAVTALGADRHGFWDSLREGRSGIGPLTQVDASRLQARNAAEVRGFDPALHFEGRETLWLDRFAQLAMVAAREAVADAGTEWTDELRERTAVVTGCCVGGQSAVEQGYVELFQRGRTRVHPMSVPRIMSNAGASQISTEMGILGPTYNVSTACASSSHALGQAFWMVRQGQVEMAVTGGAESALCLGYMKAWEAAQVLDPESCRPFSRNRRGTVLGEGAAMLVLETLDGARARGAHIHGEVVGFGMTADAHHITQPSGDGAVRAMRLAMADAGVRAEEVGYVNAHGTGTPLNDRTEAAALHQLFGAHARDLLVSSTKSMHGHAQGAAGRSRRWPPCWRCSTAWPPPPPTTARPTPTATWTWCPTRPGRRSWSTPSPTPSASAG
jgi:nodulation protein E